MLAKIIIRNSSKDDWFDSNPLLEKGEMGYENDTSKFKIGNGVDYWNDLPYQLGQWKTSNNLLQHNDFDVLIGKNLQVDGNLFVKGTKTILNSKEVTFNDRILTLNWPDDASEHHKSLSDLISGIEVNIGIDGDSTKLLEVQISSINYVESTDTTTVNLTSSSSTTLANSWPSSYYEEKVLYISDGNSPDPDLAFTIKQFEDSTDTLILIGDASGINDITNPTYEIHDTKKQIVWNNFTLGAGWYVDDDLHVKGNISSSNSWVSDPDAGIIYYDLGNVGIGSSSPGQILHVGGDVRGQIYIDGTSTQSPTLTLDHTSYTNGRKWILYSGGSAAENFDIYDATANLTRFSIDENGNVGIGETDPNTKLHVVDTNEIVATLTNSTNSDLTKTLLRFSQNVDSDSVSGNIGINRLGANAGCGFEINLADGAGNEQNRLTIIENGRVGIGTSSPEGQLHIDWDTGFWDASQNKHNPTLLLEAPDPTITFRDKTNDEEQYHIRWQRANGETDGTGLRFFRVDHNIPDLTIDLYGNVVTPNDFVWMVSDTNLTWQKADARADGDEARLHWHGSTILENGNYSSTNFKHAWYDGDHYINVDVESDAVKFTHSDTNQTAELRVNNSKVFHEGNDIPQGVDLNDYRTTGFYIQTTNIWTDPSQSGSEGAANYPVHKAGILKVFNYENGGTGTPHHTVQMYHEYATSNVWTRYYYNPGGSGTAGWTGWVNLNTDISGVVTEDNFINGIGFNTSNGFLTATVSDGSSQGASLDGRYLLLSGGTLTGNLGVGVTSATAPLDVDADSNAVNISLRARTGTDYSNINFRNDAGSSTLVDIGAVGDNFRIFTGSDLNNERLRIDGNGNVGIGTSSPDVYNIGGVGRKITTIQASDGYSVLNLIDSDDQGSYLQFGNLSIRRGSLHFLDGSDFVISTNPTNSGTSLEQRMKVTSGGDVIIESGKLKVRSSNIMFNNEETISGAPTADGALFRYDNNFFSSNSDALVIEKTDNNGNNPDGGIAFTNRGADGIVETSMVIKGNGNVGIGTTLPLAPIHASVPSTSAGGTYVGLFENLSSQDSSQHGVKIIVEPTPNTGVGNYPLVISNDGDTTENHCFLVRNDGRVDIGYTVGETKLSVAGAVGTQNGSESSPTHTFYSDSDTGAYRPAVNQYAISTGGSERIRVDENGNVAIGRILDKTIATNTTYLEPTSPLHIFKDVAVDSGVIDMLTLHLETDDIQYVPSGPSLLFKCQDTNNADNTTARIKMMTVQGNDYENVSGALGAGERHTNLIFETTANEVSSDKMIITGSGKVGIGTTSPDAPLHVDSGSGNLSAKFSSLDEFAYISFEDNGTSTPPLVGAQGDDLIFWTSNSTRLKIDSSGTLTIKGRVTEFGEAGSGANVNGAFLSIEGNTDTGGEASGRLFFREHNSSTAGADNYGLSIGYRGGGTSITTANGGTWTGLTQIGNGEWGFWGHDNDIDGVNIMGGDREGTKIFTTSPNFGVGITNPQEKLDVNGAIRLASTANNNPGTIKYTSNDFFGYNGTEWLSLTSGGSASSYISDTAPTSPEHGDFWWDSDDGELRIYYTDADGTSQWVTISGGGSSSGGSSSGGTTYYPNLNYDSGAYIMPLHQSSNGNASNISSSLGSPNVYFWPIHVSKTITVDSFQCRVGGGASGSSIMAALYDADSTTLKPDSKVIDFGSAPTTSSGVLLLTANSSVNIDPGVYYIAFYQEWTSTKASFSSVTNASMGVINGTSWTGSGSSFYSFASGGFTELYNDVSSYPNFYISNQSTIPLIGIKIS